MPEYVWVTVADRSGAKKPSDVIAFSGGLTWNDAMRFGSGEPEVVLCGAGYRRVRIDPDDSCRPPGTRFLYESVQ